MNELPTRPIDQTLGDVGETAAILTFKKWGWTADKVASDYGEDVDCNIFIDNRRTALHFRCQVKSAGEKSNYVRRLKTGNFSTSISTRTLRTWLFSYFPVLLIVYDDDNQELYWADATAQVRSRPQVLAQKTATVNVSRANMLRSGAKAIQQLVQRFYERMLRLASANMSCEVYSILMPGYRALSLQDWVELSPIDTFDRIISKTVTAKDLLPAWTTILKFMQSLSGLFGWRLSINEESLDGFINTLRKALKANRFNLKSGRMDNVCVQPNKDQCS